MSLRRIVSFLWTDMKRANYNLLFTNTRFVIFLSSRNFVYLLIFTKNKANVDTWIYYVERTLLYKKEVAVVQWSARVNFPVVLWWTVATRVQNNLWQTIFKKFKFNSTNSFRYVIFNGQHSLIWHFFLRLFYFDSLLILTSKCKSTIVL